MRWTDTWGSHSDNWKWSFNPKMHIKTMEPMPISNRGMPDRGQSLEIQDMKESPWEKQIPMVKSYRKPRSIVTNKNQNLSDIMAQQCTYCGLPGMHPKGIDFPAYGRRCNICFKLNHFPTVCRTKIGHRRTREKQHTHDSNTKLLKTVVQNDNSDDRSDDDFLVQATEHMNIWEYRRLIE